MGLILKLKLYLIPYVNVLNYAAILKGVGTFETELLPALE